MIPLEELSRLPIRTTYSLGSGGTFLVNQSFIHGEREHKYSEEFSRDSWHELILHGFLYQAQTFGEIDGKKGWNRKYFGAKFQSPKIPLDMANLNGIVTSQHVPLVLPNGANSHKEMGEHHFYVRSNRSDLELYPGTTHLGDLVYVEPTDVERIKLIFKPEESIRFTNKALYFLSCIPRERNKIGQLFTHFPTKAYREKEEPPTYD